MRFKFILSIGFLVIIVIAGGFFGYTKYQAKQLEKHITEYNMIMKTTVLKMLDGAAEAENMTNDYSQVWHDAIYNRSVLVNGTRAYDFNKALELQRTSFDQDGTQKKLSGIRDDVEKDMALLINPPEEYKRAYESLLQMYGSFTEFTGLALNPTGSLTSFNANREKLDNEFMRKYNEFKVISPLFSK